MQTAFAAKEMARTVKHWFDLLDQADQQRGIEHLKQGFQHAKDCKQSETLHITEVGTIPSGWGPIRAPKQTVILQLTCPCCQVSQRLTENDRFARRRRTVSIPLEVGYEYDKNYR